ncbi:hypothetical protein GW17_00048460 [Ensete ventricosum]|nr:hypothetical protein GW17_00048460 [Ensete ventricosum]RZS03279.1 hypothetical protein BHM03_00033444 [Ensete ventricosum]
MIKIIGTKKGGKRSNCSCPTTLSKAAYSLGREQGCCSQPRRRLQGREQQPQSHGNSLHAAKSGGCMGTLAAKVSWLPEVTLQPGIPCRKDYLGGQGLLATHGRLQPWDCCKRSSLGTRVLASQGSPMAKDS